MVVVLPSCKRVCLFDCLLGWASGLLLPLFQSWQTVYVFWFYNVHARCVSVSLPLTQISIRYPTDSLCTPHDPLSKIWSFQRTPCRSVAQSFSFDTSITDTSHGSQVDTQRNPFQTSDQTLKWSRTDRSRTARSVVSHFVPNEPFRQVLCDCSSILCGVGFARLVLHWRRYRNW